MVRKLLALILVLAPAFAQTPVDFALTLKDGKTTFRLGEAIEVEFRFTASQPNQYAVWTVLPVRQGRLPEYDHFTIDPAASVVDPLADIVNRAFSDGIVGSSPAPLPTAPVTLNLPVNEWLSIRKPGHYRISAETTRVVPMAAQGKPFTLKSNAIEIDVVAAEAGWVDAQVQQASATLEKSNAPATEVEAAARTLRFLDTPAAVGPLTRFFQDGPTPARAELYAGLFASPFRKEIIAAMEARDASPDVAVKFDDLKTLIELAKASRFGPSPAYTAEAAKDMQRWLAEVDRPYAEKTQGVDAEYFAKLAEAIPQKRGPLALTVSLETVLTHGPQPPPPPMETALLKHFGEFPEAEQWQFLNNNWYRVASPELTPLVESIAGGNGHLRDAALARLYELNPPAAQKIMRERVAKLDVSREVYNNPRALLELPDKTLPDLDAAFASALEQGKPGADWLTARYATGAVAKRLEAWVDQSPARFCSSPVLPAYFFRVDADWAAKAMVRARTLPKMACLINLSPSEDLLMSPGLEKQAVADLASPNPGVVRVALRLLRAAGSAAAEQPLLQAFARFHANANPSDAANRGIDQAFVAALLTANRWVPSPDSFVKAMEDCAPGVCQNQVRAARKDLAEPVSIDIAGSAVQYPAVRMGDALLHGDAQLRERLAHFPEGTQFYIKGAQVGNWYYTRRAAEVSAILDAAGMKLVAAPPPVQR